jgi:hypothetical protein
MRNNIRILATLIILISFEAFAQPAQDGVYQFQPRATIVSPSATPFDWNVQYGVHYPEDPITLFAGTSYPQYYLGYYCGRYSLPGFVYLYKVTHNTSYLYTARDQINQLFSPTLFQDGTNGADDGFMGWKNEREDGLVSIAGGIQKNVWTHFKIHLETVGGSSTRFTLTINSQDITETANFLYPSGTIALLSS